MKHLQPFKKEPEEADWREEHAPLHPARFMSALRSYGLVVAVIATATLISIGFRHLGYNEANYIMTYNLGVVVIAYLTDRFLYCVVASFLSMLTYNFFFTVPYFTLLTYSPEYPVTFISMLLSALIASTLTSSVKRESRRAENREKRIRILYHHEKNLLEVNSKPQLLKVAAKDISELFATSVLITAADLGGQLSMRHVVGSDIFQGEAEAKAMQETFQSGMPCGAGNELYPACKAYYLPIVGSSGVLGVIGIAKATAHPLPDSQKLFLDAIAAQVALAMERERLYEKQQRGKLEMERERLRGDLLRSVSHDLRTPLTGMLGAVATLMDNYDTLDDAARKEFLADVYREVEWLSALVENVLSLTRLESQWVNLQKQPEVVEEIVAEALSRVNRRIGTHTVTVKIPDELLLVPMDATLIEQVLVNLLDNAIKHTPADTPIHIAVRRDAAEAVFEISDRGPGLAPESLPYLFDRFYARKAVAEGRKGAGIGLSICKSIVEAHGGRISADNDTAGGAVFRFTLPLEG